MQNIVTYSGYRLAGLPLLFKDIPYEVLKAAKSYVNMYQPSSAFVIDIAETQGEYKIIEYNCLNGSSLYAADSSQLFFALNEFIDRPNIQKRLKKT